jgi:hypothetical protein
MLHISNTSYSAFDSFFNHPVSTEPVEQPTITLPEVEPPRLAIHDQLKKMGHAKITKYIRVQYQILQIDQKEVKKYLAKQLKSKVTLKFYPF